MSVVGRAYVTVRAITNQLGRDIRSGVDSAMSDVDVTGTKDLGAAIGDQVGAGIDESGLSEKVDENVRRSTEKSESSSHDYGQRIGNALGDAIGGSLLERGPIERAFTRMAVPGNTEGYGEKIGRKVLVGVGSGMLRVGLQPAVWIGALALPALETAIGVAGSLTGSLISTVAAMGPALAAVGAVGAGAYATLFTAIGTVTGALKANTEELANFKESLAPIQEEFRGIGQAIQRELLPSLSEAATRATTALGPTMRTELAGTGDAIGDIALQAARLTEAEAFQENFAGILRSNTSALRDFGAAGVDSLDMAVRFGDAAGPLFNRFSQWTRDLADSAEQQVQVADETGRLDRFLDRAGDTAAQLGDILGDTFGGLGDILHESVGPGEELLDGLERSAARFQAWTDSVEGRNSIREFFENATPVTQEFGKLVGAVMDEFTQRGINEGGLVDSMRVLRSDVVPALGDVLSVATEVSRELLSAVGPAVGTFAEDLLPAVERNARTIGRQLGPALQDLAPELADVTGAALDLVGAMSPVLGPAGELAEIAAETLTPALRGTATVLNALPDSVTGAVIAVGALRIAFGSFMRSARFENLRTSISNTMSTIRTEMATTQTAGGRFRAGLSGAMGVLGGPWGIALGVGATAIGLFAQSAAEAEAEIDEVTSTLNKQTGEITGNTRAWAANRLEEEGVLSAASRLGVDLETVTDAALGQADAQREVNAALKEADAGNLSDIGGVASQVDEDIGLLNREIGNTNERLNSARGEFNRTEAAIGNAGKSSERFARGTREVGDSAGRAANDQRRLTAAVLAYQKATAEAISGNIGLEQAIDDAAKEMREGRRTLNIHTQAGRDNMTALLDIAAAADSVTGSAEKQQRALERGRNKIIQYADSLGLTRKEAVALADRIINLDKRYENLPDRKETKVEADTREANERLDTTTRKLNDIDGREAHAGIDVNAGSALLTLEQVERNLDGLMDKTIDVTVDYVATGSGKFTATGRAGGGWVLGPGTSTSDSIPYGSHNISNLEFVVNAQSAAANARLVEAINRSQGPVAVGGGGQPVYLTVNNPTAERTSESLQNSLVELAQLGLLATPEMR